jgi:1-acyl-sn-glycerol-3-phosphate acyltransferase
VLWGFESHHSDRIPRKGAVIIACNHISNWDPILVGLGCRREVSFVAKEELFRNPFLGALIRAYNAVPVRRGLLDRRGLKLALGVLEKQRVLLVFPEGSRSKTGDLGDAQAGVGFLAAVSRAPVVPACITGSQTLLRALARKCPVRVAFGHAIAPCEARSSEAYRELADRIMGEIRCLRKEVSVA